MGLIATLVAAVMAVGVSSISATARVQLTGEVASNFRGVYDILVRPISAQAPFERDSRLVQPNFLSGASGQGLTFADLEQIRALPDVGVAAPASALGWIALPPMTPSIVSALPPSAQMHESSVELAVDDGLGPRTFYSADAQFMARTPTADNRVYQWTPDGLAMPAGEPVPPAQVFLAPLPDIRFPVLAVDPEAEAALLGPAGSGLTALTAEPRPSGGFTPENIPDRWRLLDGGPQDDSLAFASAMAEGPPASRRPVFPVVVSESLIAQATATIRDRAAPLPESAVPPAGSSSAAAFAEAVDAVNDWGAVATQTSDFTTRLHPLGFADIAFALPHSSADLAVAGLTTRLPGDRIEVGPLRLTAVDSPGRSDAFVVEPAGEAPFGSDVEQTYRSTTSIPMGPPPSSDADQVVFFHTVGSFDPEALAAVTAQSANPVPLGAYDVPASTLDDGRTLAPTFSPGGLVSTPPLAIADIRDAPTLRGAAPIDAVRVRLAGSLTYDRAGLARVEQVASKLRDLGFAVDIVAGSSPQQVTLRVPDYLMADGTTRELVVHQQWTTLGAAQRVDTALSSATVALMGLGLATALAGVASAEALHVLVRRREIASLRSIGWSRRRVAAWFVGEGAAQALVVAALAAGAWWLGGRSLIGLAAGLGVALLALVVDAIAVLRATRDSKHATSAGSRMAGDIAGAAFTKHPRVLSSIAYGVRSVVARPWRTVSIAACIAVLATALGVMMGIVVSVADRVGATELAGATLTVMRPFQIALLVSTAIVGVVISVVLLRHDARDRQREWRVLNAVGWAHHRVSASLWSQRCCIAVLAALGAGAGAWVVGPRVVSGGATSVWVVAIAVAALSPVWSAPFHRPGVGATSSAAGRAG